MNNLTIPKPLFKDIKAMFLIAKEENYSFNEFMACIKNPVEFNNGCCTSFAEHYAKIYPSATICDSGEFFDEIKIFIPNYEHGTFYHCFIKINDLFYDYESLAGVNSVINLPFFKRISKKI